MRRRERNAERETGLTGAQRFALRQLAVHNGAAVSGLARLTSTDPSLMPVVVTRLLEKKMVQRERAALRGQLNALADAFEGWHPHGVA